MGLPEYFADTVSMVTLPISWDLLSNPYPETREIAVLETGRGVTFEYELWKRRTPTFIFTIPKSLLPEFKAMHDAVVGQAFTFIPDIGVSPMDAMLVRKEPNFSLEPLGVYLYNGQPEQFFKYSLILRAEITAAMITPLETTPHYCSWTSSSVPVPSTCRTDRSSAQPIPTSRS